MRTGELVKGKVGLCGRETPRPQWLMQQKFLMLIKGEAGLHSHSGPQGGGALLSLPGISPSSLQTGKGEGRVELAVLWVSLGGGVYHCVHWPGRSHTALAYFKAARGCGSAVCAGGREVGLEDSQSSLPHPRAPDPSGSRLTMSFDLTESCVSFCAGYW